MPVMTRRNGLLAAQAIGTIVLLVVLFRNFDWTLFWAVMRRMSPAFFLLSLGAIAAGQVLYAIRWFVVLRGVGVTVTYGEALRLYLVGLFFSNLMPTAIGGDAVKIFYLGRRAGYVEAGASIFVDRFLGLLCLTILGASLAWIIGGSAPVLILNRNLLTAFAAVFVVLVGAAWLVPIERQTGAVLSPRFGAWQSRIVDFVMLVRRGTCRPDILVTAAIVVASYALLIALIYRAHFAANGVAVGILPLLLVFASMSIFVNIPLSLNGIGLREQLHVVLFTALGVPKELAVSIAVLLFAHALLISLIGAAFWLQIKRT